MVVDAAAVYYALHVAFIGLELADGTFLPFFSKSSR
jgi:hypothetical protein